MREWAIPNGWTWRATAGLMLLAMLPLAGCTSSEADGRTPSAPKPLAIAIEPVTVEARTLPGSPEVTGTLNADAETDVASETAARVMRVNAERGQVVEAGHRRELETDLVALDVSELDRQKVEVNGPVGLGLKVQELARRAGLQGDGRGLVHGAVDIDAHQAVGAEGGVQ